MNKTNSDFDYKSALCAQTDPELFFPETWQNSTVIANAKAICNNCPVRLECLQEALTKDYNDGIWGGMTPAERYALLGGQGAMWRATRRSLRPKGDTRVIRITKKESQ